MRKSKNIKTIIVITLITFLFTTSAYAEEQKEQVLKLNEAINKAFAYSVKLKNAKIDIDTKEIQRDNAKQAIDYTPINYNYNPADTTNFKTFYGIDSAYRNSEKKLESDKRQLIIDVTTAYHNVLRQQNALQQVKFAYAKELIKLGQAESKYKVGMNTTADILDAKSQLETANTAIKAAEANLDNAYKELNKLVGADVNAKPNLEEVIEFLPLEFDTGTEVLKVLNNSYEMWQVEEAVKTAGITKYFEYWSDIGINTEKQAENTLWDTKEQMKVSVTALCNGIKTLESNYTKTSEQIKQLEEKLRVIKVQNELGMTTRDNVLAVEDALLQAKNGRTSIASEYTLKVLALNKLTGELDTNIK